ncbi:MAG TPA: hypothetical protein VGR62_22850 [Candidatus Binatia bacterium]|jgi:hypothetical protein|nr:hypothetical protein [Candidatus Binatia bacterium]
MSGESSVERRRFAVLIAAAFVVLTVPRLLLHELWRDEAWLWLVVTESAGLEDLFSPLQRSGQGYLFPVLCLLARQVSVSPRAMQLVHLLLAGVAVYTFARWAPLRRRERVLFLLGYLPFYEYAVISRHYVAGMVLVWLACVAACSRRPALALGILLGLLCQTTVYGYVMAIAIAAGWMLDRRLRRADVPALSWLDVSAGLGIGVAGAIMGLVQLVPQDGTSFAPGWRFDWDAEHARRVLEMPWRAFVPVPRLELHFWNTNLLDRWPDAQAMAGVVILGLAFSLLWPRRVSVLTFGLGAVGLLAFGYVKYIGTVRHMGHFWLLFATALWLGGGLDGQSDRRTWRARTLLVLLIVHCGVGVYASLMDVRHPFSNGAAIADLIRSEGLEGYPLFGHREPPAATVALALGRPLYSPSRHVFTTHPDWGPEQRELDPQEVRCAARALAHEEGRDVVLVMTWDLPSWAEMDAVGARLGAIQASEDYRVYRLRYDRLDATARVAGCERLSP